MSAVSITGTNWGQQRATCWSITINNPRETDMKVDLPAGWKIEGQIEEGAEGTPHYQAMLTTPQVRASAVKKLYPRAHIEIARDRKALQQYVHKDDTRIQEVEARQSDIPTLWDFQNTIAEVWDHEQFEEHFRQTVHITKGDMGEAALSYIDSMVRIQIENGVRGVEFIAINPLWRSSWKRFWRSIIKRRDLKREAIDEISLAIDEIDTAASAPADR